MSSSDIEITVSRQDAASRTFAVSVPAERVRAAEVEVTRNYRRQVKLPGFRKGHAPEPVVRRRFGEAIRQAVLQDVLREAWEQARERESLKPIGDPQVRNVFFEDGAPLTFELSVDVKPELTLERTTGFHLTRQAPSVRDEDVEAQILTLREQKAPWMPAEGRPKPGDLVEATIVNLDDQGEVDGEADGEPVRFVLGQGRALPDLETHVMELDPGATWEGTVRFPEDHPEEAKRGQARRLRVTLREVKRQALPQLDEAFAREVGEFDSVEALRAAVRSDLEADAAREAESRLRAELVDQIAAANNVAVPPSLLDRATHAYARAYGVPEEEHGRFLAEFRPLAEAQVRRDLIIESVAEAHGLHATAEDVENRIGEIAARRGETVEKVRAALEKSGRIREIERSLTDDKVFAHLLGESAVEDAPAAR